MKKLLIILLFVFGNANPMAEDYYDYKFCVITNTPSEICSIAKEIIVIKNRENIKTLTKDNFKISAKMILENYVRLDPRWQNFLFTIKMDQNVYLIDKDDIQMLVNFLEKNR